MALWERTTAAQSAVRNVLGLVAVAGVLAVAVSAVRWLWLNPLF